MRRSIVAIMSGEPAAAEGAVETGEAFGDFQGDLAGVTGSTRARPELNKATGPTRPAAKRGSVRERMNK